MGVINHTIIYNSVEEYIANVRDGKFLSDIVIVKEKEEELFKYVKENSLKDNSLLPLLAYLYLHGIGVEKNLDLAKKYFMKSSINGNKDADEILKEIL